MFPIYLHLPEAASSTYTLLSISAILMAGFLITRITKHAKLPNVTGYILAGVLIGPHVLGLVPAARVESMGFVSDIALAFIAFGVGRFFTKEAFEESGAGVIVITIFEAVVAGILVTLGLRLIFKADWNFCLLLGAIATATAPASTMATIRQYKAGGNFVNTLLQVVAFDDAVCLAVFSVAAAVINAGGGSQMNLSYILMPIFYNILALVGGYAGGRLLAKFVSGRSTDNRLILTISVLLGIAGLCAAADISPLLACMVMGTVYINRTGDECLFDQADSFTAPILSIFFVVSGMNLDITSFGTLGVIGAAYFVIRIAGKCLGSYIGCRIAKAPKNVRDYLGLALIPQAGVAIGLAFLGKRMLPEATGNMLLTVILSSSVLYELVGPVCAKIALIRSGAIPPQQEPEVAASETQTANPVVRL